MGKGLAYGSGHFETFRRVTLPLARPAILSAALLLFVVGIESFDVPQLLGGPHRIYTVTSLIYSSVDVFYPPDYGRATALATGLLVAAMIGVHFYRRTVAHAARFETVKGKGYRAGIVDIGLWKWVTFAICLVFVALTIVLPLAVLVMGSLLDFYGRFDMSIFNRMTFANYRRIASHPQLINGFINSLALAIVAGGLCVLLAAVVAFITVKSRWRFRAWLDFAAMLPIAFPATVLGLALLWAWIKVPLPVYGTLLILAIAYITRYLPIGLRTVSGGIIQLSAELEEASRMAGASWVVTFRRIVLPLLRPTLAAAWLMMFMIFVRELSMSILLAGPGNPVVSVVLFDYYTSGELGPLSAASLVMAAVTISFIVLARLIFRIDYAGMKPA